MADKDEMDGESMTYIGSKLSGYGWQGWQLVTEYESWTWSGGKLWLQSDKITNLVYKMQLGVNDGGLMVVICQGLDHKLQHESAMRND